MKYLCAFLALILTFSMAFPALAQNYEPGSVIILKKNNGDLKTLDQKRRETRQERSNAKEVAKGVTIQQNSTRQPLVVTKNTNKKMDKVDKEDAVLSQAYSSHLFSSVCAEQYRDNLAPKTEKNLDIRRMWTDIQASCKCLSGEILSQVQPADLTDYVMFNYGPQNYEHPDAELTAYDNSDKSGPISDLVSNQQLRNKCGFLK